jgi:hypothetical protein
MTINLTQTPAPLFLSGSANTFSVVVDTVNVNRLGYFIDGYSELIENMEDKVDVVQTEVHRLLIEREMPDIKVGLAKGHVGVTSQMMGNTRNYITTTTYPGVTTTVYIGKHGKDLYVSWSTFIKRIPNWLLLGLILAWSSFMGFTASATVIATSIKINQVAYDIQTEVQGLLNGSGFSGSEENRDIEPLIRPFTIAIFTLFWLATITLFWFAGILSTLIILGYYLLQDPLYFLTVHPNRFDADDIVAMSQSVHKSLLKALDKIGIDTSRLRLKQDFKRASRTQSI